jgi:hypothetical protein
LLLSQQFQNFSSFGRICAFVCKLSIKTNISLTEEPVQTDEIRVKAALALLLGFAASHALRPRFRRLRPPLPPT